MKKNKEFPKKIKYILFFMYSGAMLYLLFVRSSFGLGGTSYWETVRRHMSLTPFSTIKNYAAIFTNRYKDLYGTASINLFGNIIMFIPYGFMLPWLFPRLGRLFATLFTVIVSISVIEVVQALSLRGTCDIDDLILNTFGALIGYIIWKVAGSVKNAGKRN